MLFRSLQQLDWPGNVRQLENLCRWLTVMASGREVHMEDLPSELKLTPIGASVGGEGGGDWRQALSDWAAATLIRGESEILNTALPEFERTLINVALKHSGGHRQDAARLLGWGRNTLTRKIKELNME